MTEIFDYDTDFFDPEWFYRNLVEDKFPWDSGQVMSFQDFESKYTLHDSGWGSTNIARGFDCLTLVIDWDVVWLPKSLNRHIENETGRVYLLIRLSGIEEIRIINGAIPQSFICIIAGHDLVEISGKKILSISDVASGEVEITYAGKETFLAITEQGTILEL
jgi:hypothetical protein